MTRARHAYLCSLSRVGGGLTTDEIRELLAAVEQSFGAVDAECDACEGVANAEYERIQERISAGKGEWPHPGYVRDEDWARWHGEKYGAVSIARRIRARKASR